MKRIILLIVSLFLSAGFAVSVNAATLDGTPPRLINPPIQAALDLVNDEIAAQFIIAEAEANTELNKFSDFSELSLGFANANVYASQAGTVQGYQDYDLFAVSTGFMMGVQLPSTTDTDFAKMIEDDGDIYAGISLGLSIVNIGLNAGLLYDGLYLNAKFGTYSRKIEDTKFKTTLFGIGANYQYIRSVGVLAGLAKWRGISFGTGFTYLGNSIDYQVDLDPVSSSFSQGITTPIAYTVSGDVVINPSINLGLKVNTYTIPLDVTTSAQLLWIFNFTLGAGIDLNFGSSKITAQGIGITSVENLTGAPTGTTVQSGNVTIDSGAKAISPSFLRPRISAGVGFNFGPLKIDVPVIYYLKSGGAVGVTAGIVW